MRNYQDAHQGAQFACRTMPSFEAWLLFGLGVLALAFVFTLFGALCIWIEELRHAREATQAQGADVIPFLRLPNRAHVHGRKPWNEGE